MESGMPLSHAEPDVLSVLILFIAIVLFGLLIAGGLWLLAKLSERMGWSKRRRRRSRLPRGTRTRAPSKAVSFARLPDRLDQLELSLIPLPTIGDPRLFDALEAWAITRGAPDLRARAQVALSALFTVTSPGTIGRAGSEVLRGQMVDYVLADPGGMPIAGLMQTDPDDIHTATLMRETVLRDVFRKTDLPLIEIGPGASEADIHAALDVAFDLTSDRSDPVASRPSHATPIPTPQAEPETSPLRAPPQLDGPMLGRGPRAAVPQGRLDIDTTPLPRPGRRTRSGR